MFIRHSITPLLQITLKTHIHNHTIVTLLSKNIRMIFAYFFFYETQILNHCNCNKKWHMTRDRGYPMAQYNWLKKSTKITGNLLLKTLPRKNLIFLFNMAREFPVQAAHFIVLELGHRTNGRTNINFCSQKLS